MDRAEIYVPSSTANVGPGYDIWSIGFTDPSLHVTGTRIRNGVEVEYRSPYTPPPGREFGYAGRKAAERFLRKYGIREGVHMLYECDGFPAGGLGLSGAEIVGSSLVNAVIFGKKLSRDDIIGFCARVEGHPDNVAASTSANFNIAVMRPGTKWWSADSYPVPNNLGVVMGFSSHEKTGGTEAGRKVLRQPVSVKRVLVPQTALVSATTAALVSGNTDRYLELVKGDGFHEPRRAKLRFYGGFDNVDLAHLKDDMFRGFHVAWVVSGAGPNMLGLYNKDEYPDGVIPAISPLVVPRFRGWGIEMNLREMEIAKEGAYGYAQRVYGF